MATDENALTDEVVIELNGKLVGTVEMPPIPDRPDDASDRDEWVEYVVALGADRNFVEAETAHWEGDPDNGEYVLAPALETEQLKDLAKRLGG